MSWSTAPQPLKQLQQWHEQTHTLVVLPDGTRVASSTPSGPLGPIAINMDGIHVLSFVPNGREQLRGIVGTIPPDANLPLPVLEILPESSSLSIHQLWAGIYALWVIPQYTMEENIFISLQPDAIENYEEVRRHLLLSGLAYNRLDLKNQETDLVLSRFAFWQGAGVPSPEAGWAQNGRYMGMDMTHPLVPTVTLNKRVATTHPTRAAKPEPGTTIYRRYVPTLKETITFIALDPDDPIHFEAFHKWQNDPRVSQGWNETGDEEHHKRYLWAQWEDPHTFPVLAAWDGKLFGYFEFTWAKVKCIDLKDYSKLIQIPFGKEDHITPHTGTMGNEWDRGYHVLVGDAKYRGFHRCTYTFGLT